MGQSTSTQENDYRDTSWTEISNDTPQTVKKRTLQNIRNAIRYERNVKVIQNAIRGHLTRRVIKDQNKSSEVIQSYLKSYQTRKNVKMIHLVIDIVKARKEKNIRRNKQSNVIKGFLKGFYERSKIKKYIKAYSLHQESKSIVQYRKAIRNNLRSILYDWKRQSVWQKCMKEMGLVYNNLSQIPMEQTDITLSNNYITDEYKLMYRFFDHWYDMVNWTKVYTLNYYYSRYNWKKGFRAFKNYVPEKEIRSRKNKLLKLKLAETIYNYNLCYKTFRKWKSLNF